MTTTATSFRKLTTILLLLLALQTHAHAEELPLVIGVLAQLDETEVQARWEPLSEYLSRFLQNRQVQVRALRYEELEKALQLHQLDFLLTDPSHYIRLRSRNSLSRVLVTLWGRAEDSPVAATGGTIIALRERTDLIDLQDLKGQTVAVMGTRGLTEYQAQAYAMIGAAMDISKDIRLIKVAENYGEVVQTVLQGKADSGFIRGGLLEDLRREGRLQTEQLRVINLQELPGFPFEVSTHLYPQWPLVALPRADPAVARKIAAALLLLEPEGETARNIGIYGFSTPANYTEVDTLLRNLRLPPYDLAPEFTLMDVWQRYRQWLIALGVAGLIMLQLSAYLIAANRRLKEYRENLEDLVANRTNALKDNQDRLETIIDNLPAIFFIKDSQGRYLQVNRGYEEAVGVSKEQAVSHTDYEIHPKGVADGITQVDRRVFTEKEPISFAERVPGADGTLHDYLTTKVPLIDDKGDAYALFGIATDVTPLRMLQDEIGQAREYAESSKQILQMVLDTIPVRVFWKDTGLKYLGCNRLFANDAGYSSPEEMIGQDDFDMAWKNEAELYRADDSKVIENDQPLLAYEEPQSTPDGKQIWLSTSKIPLKDTDGRTIGILGTYEDITKRKEAEAKLVESETSFRTLFESSSDAIMLLDENGYFDCNPATLELFGCPDVSSFSKLHPSELSPPTQPDGMPSDQAAQQKIETAFQHGRNFFEWLHWRYDDHREFPAEVLLNVMQLGERRVLQAVVRDITERKLAERSIIASMKAAEVAAKAKSDFLANMSHEIRTPLNAVLGMARIGLRDTMENESREHFSHIINSGEHLLGVINDILDVSKIEQGKLTIESHPLHLIDSMENIARIMAERAQSKGLALEVNFDDRLPEWVTGDLLRLQQILLNLISNAIKFTSQGKVSLTVTQEGETTCFRVSDSGVGISDDEITRLFRPFEQADSSTTRIFGGTGLGLTISQNLAKLMGGRIEVESKVDVGSTFTLTLPLPVTLPPATKDSAVPGQEGMQLSGLRILAAEDVEMNRIILEDLLEHEGAQVVFAKNGRQALDRVKDGNAASFDLILMDVQMPVMDGYEATRKIRELAPGLPIIGLTAHALMEEREKCLAAGMADHVTKPVEPDTLISAIRNCIKL